MGNIISRMISERKRASGSKVAGIIFLLSCVLILASCSILNGSYVFEILQKEVPFTIIVPTYLPADISPHPAGILGPGTGAYSENSVAVGFGYSNESNTKFIDIYEENGEVIFHPARPSSVYLEIRGVQVLEEEAEVIIPSESPSDNTVMHGYFYGWNQNGVIFEVTIFGYEKTECRKVIESMIK